MPYDAYYYRHGCGRPYERTPEWLGFFAAIADRIVSDIGPRVVLDAGCAMGFLVEALRDRGVEAYGIDLSPYAIEHVREDIRPFCTVGSLVDPLPRRYDLIVTIEVLEHMPPADAEKTIANFCAASDDVLFSSTPFDYKEATHFNVLPPEAWARQFARQGFGRDVDFDALFLTPWAVRFRRLTAPWTQVIGDYDRRFWQLWKENADLRLLVVEQRSQLAAQEDQAQAAALQAAGALAATQAALQAEQAAVAAQQAAAAQTMAGLQEQLDRCHQATVQYHESVTFLKAAIAQQQADWAAREQTPAYRLAHRVQQWRAAAAPPGSRRARWLSAVLGWLMRP